MVIALGYRKRSGKDEVANHLVAKYGFRKVAWADLLKRGVNLWHGWGEDHGWGDLKEVVDPYWGYSPRDAYQKIGTDLMRNRWLDDFWVKAAMRSVEVSLDLGESIVIADCRFPNEARAVTSVGGRTWHILRPDLPPPNLRPSAFRRLRNWAGAKAAGKPAPVYDHASETAMQDWNWDRTVVNDGTLVDLRAAIDSAMREER